MALRWLLVAVFAAGLAAAEVTLDLPDPLVPGATMNGSLSVQDPPANLVRVDLPPVDGLTWQHTGRTSSQTSIVNGRQASTVSLGLRLRAAQAGTLALPAVTVHFADGSSASSAPRPLRVDQGDASLTGDAQARVAFVPERIVPGQGAELVYRLFLRAGEVRDIGIAPPGEAILLGERTVAKGRTVDAQGREWVTVTVTWPLTVATPGAYTVEGQQEVLRQVGDGFFDARVERRQVRVAPAVLTVEALPAGQPADFAGLIGPLGVRASLDRERIALGEGAVLSLSVESRQTGLAKRPALALPGVQVYAKDDRSEGGTRTFTWDLVPSAPGAIAIPSLAFPYFDPATRSYRSAASTALALTVIPGRSRDLGVVGAPLASAPVAAAQTPPPPVLPAPMRGAGLRRPADAWAPLAGAAALVAGLALGVLARRPRRQGPHRGRQLRAAVTSGNAGAMAAALAALRPALAASIAEQRAAAEALQAALDRARFGGEALPDCTAWVRRLEDLP